MRLLAISLVLLFALQSAAGMSSSIVGKVHGAAGEPVPKATLILSSDHLERAVAKDDGSFRVSIQPGMYDVIVFRDGFEPWCYTHLQVEVGQTVRLDVGLQTSTTTREVYIDQPRPEDLADENAVLRAMEEPP